MKPKDIKNADIKDIKKYIAYNEKTGIFSVREKRKYEKKNVGDTLGSLQYGYRTIIYKRKKILAHRLAWFYTYSEWPENIIDHINGIRDDNRIENLRKANHTQNMHNQKKPSKNNTTGFLGIYFCKRNKNYRARITLNSKKLSAGSFPTAIEASNAYIEAKRQYHPFFIT